MGAVPDSVMTPLLQDLLIVPPFVTLLQPAVAVTVIVMQHVFVLPQLSVALKQTWLVPMGKAVPLAPPLVRVTVATPVAQVVVAVGIV